MTKRTHERTIESDATVRPKSPWPRTYQIVVEGCLEPSWSDRLAGLLITHDTSGGSSERTQLVGLIRDSAELSGVLNTLYDLHLVLLSVEVSEDDVPSKTNSPTQGDST